MLVRESRVRGSGFRAGPASPRATHFAAEQEAYSDRLNEIISGGGQIKLVQIHTLARPPAEPCVTALSHEELDALAALSTGGRAFRWPYFILHELSVTTSAGAATRDVQPLVRCRRAKPVAGRGREVRCEARPVSSPSGRPLRADPVQGLMRSL